MADAIQIAEVLSLVSKVTKITEQTAQNVKSLTGKVTGSGESKVTGQDADRVIEKPKSVIVTDFGRKAEDDLKRSAYGGGQDGQDGKQGKDDSGFIKKLMLGGMLVLGGLAALVKGLMSDGPLSQFLSLLAKGGIMGGLKVLSNTIMKPIKTFISGLSKIISKALGIVKNTKVFDTVITKVKGVFKSVASMIMKPFAKILGQGAGKGIFSKIVSLAGKMLKPVLGRLPGIGSMISWAFAFKDFKNGDLISGMMNVASGIAYLFPGIGTAVGIGIDILNAFMNTAPSEDTSKSGEGKGFKIKEFFGKIKDKMMNSYPIKNLFQFWGGVGKVFTGNFKEGFTEMAYAIPFVKPLADFLFGEVDEETGERGAPKGSFKDLFKAIREKAMTGIINSFPKMFGIQSKVASLLGIPGFDDGGAGDAEIDAYKSAKTSGLYNKDIIGASEIDKNKVTAATDMQLQAIIDDNDLRDEDMKFIKDELRKRNSVSDVAAYANTKQQKKEQKTDESVKELTQIAEDQLAIQKENTEVLKNIEARLQNPSTNNISSSNKVTHINFNGNGLRDLQYRHSY
jgi:hypothetical protein